MTTEQLPPDEQEAMETRLRLTLLASLGHGSLMAGTQEGGLFGPEDPHLHRLTVDLAKAMEAWTTVVSEVGGLGHRTGYRGFWTALEGTSETHPIFVDAVHHAALNFPDPGPTEGDLEECRDLEAMRLGMTAEDFGTPKAIPFQPSIMGTIPGVFGRGFLREELEKHFGMRRVKETLLGMPEGPHKEEGVEMDKGLEKWLPEFLDSIGTLRINSPAFSAAYLKAREEGGSVMDAIETAHSATPGLDDPKETKP